MPSISTKRASAMWWARYRPNATGIQALSRRWNTSVGTRIEPSTERTSTSRSQTGYIVWSAPGERRRIVEAAPAPGFGRTRRSRVTPPALVELLTLAFGVALAESVRVVRGMAHARERVAEHEPLGPLGIGRGEQHRDRATVTVPEDDDALAAHLVDDGRDVVHPPLDRRDGTQRHRVGNAGAPLVEADTPPHRRQSLEEARQRRTFPHDLDVVRMIWDEDDLARASPEDLVGDVALGPFHVLSAWLHLGAGALGSFPVSIQGQAIVRTAGLLSIARLGRDSHLLTIP